MTFKIEHNDVAGKESRSVHIIVAISFPTSEQRQDTARSKEENTIKWHRGVHMAEIFVVHRR